MTTDVRVLTHAERANELIEELDTGGPFPWALTVQLAQVHATMALVEAVDNWSPPTEEAQQVVPFEFTKEGQAWP